MTDDIIDRLIAHHEYQAKKWAEDFEAHRGHAKFAADLQAHRDELREVIEAVRELLAIVTAEYNEYFDTSDVEHWQPAISAGEIVLARHTKHPGGQRSGGSARDDASNLTNPTVEEAVESLNLAFQNLIDADRDRRIKAGALAAAELELYKAVARERDAALRRDKRRANWS